MMNSMFLKNVSGQSYKVTIRTFGPFLVYFIKLRLSLVFILRNKMLVRQYSGEF